MKIPKLFELPPPSQFQQVTIASTVPETNIVPENNHLEKEIPIGNHRFLGAMLNFRGVAIVG